MAEPDPGDRRDAARRSFDRELERFRRREPEHHFARSLALIGSVGWPIAGLSLGGALLGRLLDARLQTGVRLTLTLLLVGAALGTFVAFRTLRGAAS